jgi:hypothetical protein
MGLAWMTEQQHQGRKVSHGDGGRQRKREREGISAITLMMDEKVVPRSTQD